MRMMHRVGALSAAKGGGPYYKLSYSGAHTVEEVEFEGQRFEQWTLTSSGTLAVVSGVVPPAKVWMCSGGTCGDANGNRNGGGGGFAASGDDVAIAGSMPAIIGAGGTAISTASGSSSFAGISAPGATLGTSYSNSTLGTGGGFGGSAAASYFRGDGKSKIPYGDNVNFAGLEHCAGAGAGAYYNSVGAMYRGGNGGTNGGNGAVGASVSNLATSRGGTGGRFGGGNGANAASSGDNSTPGLFYGGGGGGKAYYASGSTVNTPTGNQPGYQGVVYVRIPLDMAA